VKAWDLFDRLLDLSYPASSVSRDQSLPQLAPPDRLTYSSMISAHARAGDVDGAERLLKALHYGHDFSQARFDVPSTPIAAAAAATSSKKSRSSSSGCQGEIIRPTATACNQVQQIAFRPACRCG